MVYYKYMEQIYLRNDTLATTSSILVLYIVRLNSPFDERASDVYHFASHLCQNLMWLAGERRKSTWFYLKWSQIFLSSPTHVE